MAKRRIYSPASALGVSFTAPALLTEALTHRSAAANANNQRLEFLGDRVLGLVIADRLLRLYPGEDEGALSRRSAALVSDETLAEIAADLGLGQHLILDPSEEAYGGRTNPANLSDACEAVIGALFLDGGLSAAGAFIDRHWAAAMREQGAPPVDAKTALQEWTQARGLGLPAYRTVSARGPDHRPTFRITVEIPGHGSAEGEGAGKRRAEHAAAAQMLQKLQSARG